MASNKTFFHTLIIISALLFAMIFRTPADAASTPNVTLEREIYRDMELWAAEGLTTSNMSSIRPYAASEIGRQAAEALEKCNAMANPSATCKDIQNRYTHLFDAEIAEAQSPDNIVNSYVKPLEKLSIIYNYQNGYASTYNNDGLYYGKGSNVVVQAQSQARVGHVLSFFVQPAFIYNQHFGQNEEGARSTLRLNSGYAKLTVFNLELLAGRDTLWWGPGYHGSLLMSNNAHPFDMIKLSNPEPVKLPWIFSYLGYWQFNLIFSQLNDLRTNPEQSNPFLYGMRLGLKPVRFLELGVSHLVQFGGPERRNLSLNELNQILFGNTDRDFEKTDSNQQFSADFTLTLPNLRKFIYVADGIKLYGEIGAEDNGYPPTGRAWLAGLAIYKPFGLERSVLRGEYATTILGPYNSPAGWYVHHSYPMHYEGRVFGHHMGTEAEDYFVEWSHNFLNFHYKLSFDLERSGIKTQAYTQSKKQYAGEVGYRFNNNASLTLKYAYEYIANMDNIQGANQQNQYMGVEATVEF